LAKNWRKSGENRFSQKKRIPQTRSTSGFTEKNDTADYEARIEIFTFGEIL